MTLAPRPSDEADANDALVMVYDAWNRQVKVYDDDDADGEADAGELIATYSYDGKHRRIRKVVEGDPNDVTYDYYYNTGWRILEIRKDDDTDPYEQYVWGIRYVHSPVCRFEDHNLDTNVETLYYCNDANFNVTALINTDGTVAERYVYDAYGKVTIYNGDWTGTRNWTDAACKKNIVLYTGHKFDAESGLFQAGYRYYHPTLGRWVTRDPKDADQVFGGYHDGMNLFEYVRSMPNNRVDPSGNWETAVSSKFIITDWGMGGEVQIETEYIGQFKWWHYLFKTTFSRTKSYKAGNLQWLSSNMQGIKATNGTLVGYEQAVYWLQCKRGSAGVKANWLAYVKAHDASSPCGPEATDALVNVLSRIKTWYNAKTKDEQSKLCCTAFDYWEGGPNKTAAIAWDINQLYMLSKTGFKEPGRSVRVSGKCYDAAAVNYVMFGLMGKVCNKSFDAIWGKVKTWKKMKYGVRPDKETEAWAKAGFNGWTPRTKVYSFTPYSVVNNRERRIFARNHFTFTWLPYMHWGAEGNHESR